ncbi:TPA: hypothetical protein KV183_001264 [Morganella morganii]|nr:hypothetical protein [Morganella morganii]
MKSFLMLNSDQLTKSMSASEKTSNGAKLGVTEIRGNIDSCILDNGDFDGSSLSDLWFPVDNYDIFISHSHRDLGKAYSLALDFINHGKTVFIDSFLWGYNEELIRKIKEKVGNTSNEAAYNIEKNINLLLANALSNAVYKSENFLFINTENSLITNIEESRAKIKNDTIKSLEIDTDRKTYSPWIMHELTLSRIIHDCQRKAIFESVASVEEFHNKEANIQLPAEIRHLQEITLTSLYKKLRIS